MSTTNRASLLAKTHKILKKHFKPRAPVERPLLEELVYACCLENATYEAADKAYAALVDGFEARQPGIFFDWNEIRVTTRKELSEVLAMLPQPEAVAERLKKLLQAVFEKMYSFDIESLRKQNLGKAIKQIETLSGTTPFIVACVTQSVLGGHRIPLDDGALGALSVIGVLTPAEIERRSFGAIERAIAKNKGVEFGSLLHQFGAELLANPYSTNLHKVVLEIDPAARPRLPRRAAAKAAREPEQPPAASRATRKKAVAVKAKPARPAAPARAVRAAAPKGPVRKPVAKKKTARKKPR